MKLVLGFKWIVPSLLLCLRVLSSTGDCEWFLANYSGPLLSNEVIVDYSGTRSVGLPDYDTLTTREKLSLHVNELPISATKKKELLKRGIFTLGEVLERHPDEVASKERGYRSIVSLRNFAIQLGLPLPKEWDAVPAYAATTPTVRVREGQPSSISVRDRNEIIELLQTVDLETRLHYPVAWVFSDMRARKCIAKLRVCTLGELIKHSRDDLLELRNVGSVTTAYIELILSQLDLKLADVSKKSEVDAVDSDYWYGRLRALEREKLLELPLGLLPIEGGSEEALFSVLAERTLARIIGFSESELRNMPGMGKRHLEALKSALGKVGLSLRAEEESNG